MTRTTTVSLGILFILAIIGGVWVYANWNAYAPGTYVIEKETSTTTGMVSTTTTTTVNTSTGATTPGSPVYTLEQVATNDDASSCYTVIRGKVYDLTLWINMHPGGRDKILSICGIDGTARFMEQHKGAQKQMDILKRFYVGNLSR